MEMEQSDWLLTPCQITDEMFMEALRNYSPNKAGDTLGVDETVMSDEANTAPISQDPEFTDLAAAFAPYDVFADLEYPDAEPMFNSSCENSHYDDFAEDNQKSLQQAEQLVHHSEQPASEFDHHGVQIEAGNQVKEAGVQKQDSQNQGAHSIDADPQVQNDIKFLEYADHQAHSMYSTNPVGTLNLQNNADLTHVFGASPTVDTGYQTLDTPMGIDVSSNQAANENSFIVPDEQSEHGLAGLFGLSLDQVKAGERNKKAGIRNTTVEKAKKPVVNHALPHFAGVKKPKSPAAKVAPSVKNMMAKQQKTQLEAMAARFEQQANTGPTVVQPTKAALPFWIIQEEFDRLNHLAKEHGLLAYGNYLRNSMVAVKIQFLKKPENAHLLAAHEQGLLDESGHIKPFQHLQQASHTTTAMNMNMNQANSFAQGQPQHVQQFADHVSSISVNYAEPNELQTQPAYLTSAQSPVAANRASAFNTPRNGLTRRSVSSAREGIYPSPLITPPRARSGSPYGSLNGTGQLIGHQSPYVNQTVCSTPQQLPQMAACSSVYQPWPFGQQGPQVQQPLYPMPMQYAQQPSPYYNPVSTSPANGFVPQYDSQNHAQVVNQQNMMWQNQIQQPSMQYQQVPHQGLNLVTNLGAHANTAIHKSGFKVGDFMKTKKRK